MCTPVRGRADKNHLVPYVLVQQAFRTKFSLRALEAVLSLRELVLLVCFVVWAEETLLSRATVSAQTRAAPGS